MGDINAAKSFLIRAMNLARVNNILEMLRDCSFDMARFYEQQQAFRVAYFHFNNYHRYAMQIEKEKSTQQMVGVFLVEDSDSSKDIHETLQMPNHVGRNDEFRNRLLLNFPRLTPRQIEIAELLRNGMSSKEMSILINIEVDSINKQSPPQ